MEIRTIPEGAANAALLQTPSKVPAKMPAPAGNRYQMSEAHKKNCSMFMADFWSLIKMTYEREDTKQYWKELVLLADSLGKKYAGNPFALSMIMAYVDYHSSMQAEEAAYRKEAG